MRNSSVAFLLRERAGLQPDDVAFRYADYENDWAGVTETLTWAQLYQRTLNLAHGVKRHGAVGDRAVIRALQGLDYIVAFLGAMQAGLIAVPLSVPQAGSHDKRVTAVLADTAPTVVLTTSAVAATEDYLQQPGSAAAPAVIAVDALDLDVHFEPEKLSEGEAERCSAETGAPLLGYGMPTSPTVRIADPDTTQECPAGTVEEIWVKGENVSEGNRQKPEETERTFGGMLANPSPGTPEGSWLRTGDLGFVSDGDMFIVGRTKDLVYGRNHYPEDIESTVHEITRAGWPRSPFRWMRRRSW